MDSDKDDDANQNEKALFNLNDEDEAINEKKKRINFVNHVISRLSLID